MPFCKPFQGVSNTKKNASQKMEIEQSLFVGNKAKGRISKKRNKKPKQARFSEKQTFLTP